MKKLYFLSSTTTLIYCVLLFSTLDFKKNQAPEKRIAGHRIIDLHPIPINEDWEDSSITILQDQNNYFWVVNESHVYRYNEKTKIWTKVYDFTPIGTTYSSGEVAIAQNSKLLVARNNEGLGYFDGTKWEDIAFPKDYGIYIGRGSNVSLFSGINQSAWVIINTNLINYNGISWSKPKNISDLLNLRIKDIEKKYIDIWEIFSGKQSSNGHIWLGTTLGIIELDMNVERATCHYCIDAKAVEQAISTGLDEEFLKRVFIAVTNIYEDQQGRMWFGNSNNQVCVFDMKKNEWKFHDLRNHLPMRGGSDSGLALSFQAILRDKAGRVFFATDYGLLIYLEQQNKWELLTSTNSDLPNSKLLSLYEDRSGRIWIGTARGLVVLEP